MITYEVTNSYVSLVFMSYDEAYTEFKWQVKQYPSNKHLLIEWVDNSPLILIKHERECV